MGYRDEIISGIADRDCRRVARKVVRALREMTDGMQSGDDSPLRNVWEEFCVQLQSEQSPMWSAYLDTIESIIAGEVEKLDVPRKQAIWLQTNDGMDWESENEDQEEAVFDVNGIVDHILHEHILTAAADWTNKRIERYLDGPAEF